MTKVTAAFFITQYLKPEMVSEPTVLIVGAGGSKPYGYPLGTELVEGITSSLAGTNNLLYQTLAKLDHSTEEIREFRRRLFGAHVNSIDEFLENNSEFVTIGRQAIASSLLPLENQENLLGSNDWYRTLFGYLRNNFQAGKTEAFTILTYNYDRSLDFALISSLQNTFGSHADLSEIGNRLNIIHLHGILQHLPTHLRERPTTGTFRQYGKFGGSAVIAGDAAKHIKIIHENDPQSPEFVTARDALSRARRVCVIGFGHHPTNVSRLLKNGWHMDSTKRICGAAFGSTLAERRQIEGRWDYRITLSDYNCQRFLREHCDMFA